MDSEKRNYWDLIFHVGSPGLQKDYSRFLSDQKSLVMQTLIHIYYGLFYGGFFLFSAIAEMHRHLDGSDTIDFILSIALLACSLIAVSCTLLFFFINFTEYSSSFYLRDYLEPILSVFMIVITLSESIHLIRRTIEGSCSYRPYFPYSVGCNPYNEVHSLPMDSVIALMFTPLTFASFMRESRLEWTLISWLISLIALIVATAIIYSTQPFVMIAIYAFASLFIIIDFYRQSMIMFHINRKLQQTLTENQQLAEEQKATQMRHMIANVAHDLKTPLSSFMTGIDMIAEELKLCENQLTTKTIDLIQLHVVVETINSCLSNIRSTNSFMLMTINRCLDYTKASKGLKLIPRYETIDLIETLSLPLDCMRNIQQKMSIHLNPVDPQICSHVITDKQWLQENMLCLLSNAVKYSSSGMVTISVSLHEANEFRKAKVYVATPKEMVDIPVRLRKSDLMPQRGSTAAARIHPTHGNNTNNIESHRSTSSGSGGRDSNRQSNRSRSHSISSERRNNGADTELFSFHYKDPDLRKMLMQQHREMMEQKHGTNYNNINNSTHSQSSNIVQQALISATQSTSPMQTRKERHLSSESGESTAHSYGLIKAPQDNQSSKAPTIPIRDSFATTNKEEESTMYMNNNSCNCTAENASLFVKSTENNTPTAEAIATTGLAQQVQEAYSHYLLFEIEDTGIGLSEDAMQSLFNPFKQTQRLAGGTGLGLYSLAKRIDALNGQYGVKKRKDGHKGSLFWFTIPYRADHTTADSVAANRNNPLRDSVIFARPMSYDTGDGGSSAGVNLMNDHQSIKKTLSVSVDDGSLHILMAEDSHTIAKMTSMMLKRQGYKVTIAENGELAVKLVTDSYNAEEGRVKYDVVLMDLQMPVMDGLEATRRLRKQEEESALQFSSALATSPKDSFSMNRTFPHVIVIGVSANSDNETMDEAYQAGVDAFISKPFAIDTFTSVVNALIARL